MIPPGRTGARLIPRPPEPMTFVCESLPLAVHIERRLRAFKTPVRREGCNLYVTVSPDRLRLLNVRGCERVA